MRFTHRPATSTISGRDSNSGQSDQLFRFGSHIFPSALVRLRSAVTSSFCSNPVSCHQERDRVQRAAARRGR
jgi:hypothetical protein